MGGALHGCVVAARYGTRFPVQSQYSYSSVTSTKGMEDY
jgi:hypothetical protein